MEYGAIKHLLIEKLRDEGFIIHSSDSHDDTIMFKTANKDLWNYMRRLYDCENLFFALSTKFITEDEAKEFMDYWFPLWLKKWKQRTRIITRQEDAKTGLKPKKGYTLKQILSEQLYDKLSDEIISELIKVGEICATVTLADASIMKAFNSKKWTKQRKQGSITTADLVNIMIDSKRLAHELKYIHGSLIFLQWSRHTR
jgi:hypothetical protein